MADNELQTWICSYMFLIARRLLRRGCAGGILLSSQNDGNAAQHPPVNFGEPVRMRDLTYLNHHLWAGRETEVGSLASCARALHEGTFKIGQLQ